MRLATCPVLFIGLLVGFVVPNTGGKVPTINIDKTCRAAGGVTVSLLGGYKYSLSKQDVKVCLESPNKRPENRYLAHTQAP